MSFEIRSLATPSRISSDFKRPAPTAETQQHSKTYRGSPAYPVINTQQLVPIKNNKEKKEHPRKINQDFDGIIFLSSYPKQYSVKKSA